MIRTASTPTCLGQRAILSTLALATLAGFAGHANAADAAATPRVNLVGRNLPDVQQLPAGPQRDLVTYGEALTTRTFAYIGPEVADVRMRHAGNNLACSSCHQQGASKPFAMPWIGVTASFPQYRAREDDISTVEERVNGCMQRSMNGKPLPLDSREMKALSGPGRLRTCREKSWGWLCCHRLSA